MKIKKELESALGSRDHVLLESVLDQLHRCNVSKKQLKSSRLGAWLAQAARVDWCHTEAARARSLMAHWKAQLKAGACIAEPPPQTATARLVKVLGGHSELAEEKAVAILQSLGEPLDRVRFVRLMQALRKNDQLCSKLLDGCITCDELVHLSPAELATRDAQEELRTLKTFNEEASRVHKSSAQLTEQFGACPKCSAAQLSFYMLQIQSADEPMSVFISCPDCGFSRVEN